MTNRETPRRPSGRDGGPKGKHLIMGSTKDPDVVDKMVDKLLERMEEAHRKKQRGTRGKS